MTEGIDPAYRYPLYYPIRNMIQTGDMMEWAAEGNIAGELIMLKTGKPVSHTAMFVRSQIPHHKDRIFLIEAVNEGVVVSLFTDRLYHHRGKAYWSPLVATKYQRYNMLYWALTKVGMKAEYDHDNLLWNLINRTPINPNKYFCSGFYLAALIEVGLADKKYSGYTLRPGEFERLKVHGESVVIYDG